MDIYDYLKADHEFVAHLFKQFDKAPSNRRKIQIMELIAQELLVHAPSEQETFYKTLMSYALTQDIAQHGEEEHSEIEQQIADILSAKTVNANWVKKVHKLQEIVEHHVHEEEGTMFKKAKKVLSEEQACHLKEQMHYLKQNLLQELEKNLAS